jgi:hypothetical protein
MIFNSVYIDWGKIVTNAVSTIITAIVIGACYVVWNGATTVDQKVKSSSETLKNQNASILLLVDAIEDKFENETKSREAEYNEIMEKITDLELKVLGILYEELSPVPTPIISEEDDINEGENVLESTVIISEDVTNRFSFEDVISSGSEQSTMSLREKIPVLETLKE